MGLFRRLFQKKEHSSENFTEEKSKERQKNEAQSRKEINSEWRTVPNYIEADEKDYQLVSLIAAAIAAGEKPDSEFKIKKIMKVNPEVAFVSAIASAVAAENNSENKFIVKSVKKKNDRRTDDVKKI